MACLGHVFIKILKRKSRINETINSERIDNVDGETNEPSCDTVVPSCDTVIPSIDTVSEDEIVLNSSFDGEQVLRIIIERLKLKNIAIVEYCVRLLNNRNNLSFVIDNATYCDATHDSSKVPEHKPLGDVLSNLDTFLRGKKRHCMPLKEDSYAFYVEQLMEIRGVQDKERFRKDSEKFLQIYESRLGETDVLTHNKYWGCPQQMMSGKIIADFVAEEYGPLDPVFGILLNPTTGRVGPGDTGLIHNILFDEDGRWAYHAAVHDAFGYLKTFHNIGPGYNYLGGISAVGSGPYAGQRAGLLFWKHTVKNIEKLKQVIEISSQTSGWSN